MGAFEQLFGPGRGDFNKIFSKIQMPGGVARGGYDRFMHKTNHYSHYGFK